LVECKAPNVKVGKDAFDQIAKYNFSLKAKYLYVTMAYLIIVVLLIIRVEE